LRTLRELQTTDREFTSLQDASTLDLESIRGELPADTQIVELYVARGIVYACILDRSSLEIVPLTVVSRVLDIYHLLKFQLSKFLLGTDYVTKFRKLVDQATHRHLHSLYRELIEPIRHLLTARHLTIVPHDLMHLIPFHALFDGESYLIDHFSISCSPSASVDYLCRVKENEPEDRSLVLGIYDDQAPHILEEVQAVAAELGNARLLLNEDADAESLKVLGERCRILHIATHGVFRRDNPMFSAIQLGGARLSLFDLYDMRLDAELVVLSGCGTGLSVVLGADELVGLARGLLYAGARTVLVTLWDVNDASTALFMRSFYRALREELSPAGAFRRATQETREEHPHPYHWAPFVLVGRAGE
jgi:CHAT domain-containing protein